jgi:hypothetical protein
VQVPNDESLSKLRKQYINDSTQDEPLDGFQDNNKRKTNKTNHFDKCFDDNS